ncbi:MAG: helix-turn-helix transcriptional regulator [Ignavibacteria bacterium]|nr:helix-turn-helix transcriptional regulator [Ignavibacteria bacterium]
MLKKFGADLRRIREKHNITLHDIANKTRIHVTLLEKMEQGDFSFYSSTYIRAFLKQYAKCVGMKPDEILFNYEMAKSGRYSAMEEDSVSEQSESSSKTEHEEQSPEEKDKYTEKHSGNKLDDIFEVPGIKRHTITSNLSESAGEEVTEQQLEKRPFSKSKRVKIEGLKGDFDGKYYEDKGFKMPTGLLRNLGIGILILALLYGVYLLVDVVFLNKKGSKTEIIRQNFDDVVKETERKVLGKRSDQEIQDSIVKANAKADSLRRTQEDSLSLKIVGIRKGYLVLFVDTLTEKARYRENFDAEYTGEWKAKNSFTISTNNTESFTAYLNGKALKFDDKKIKLLKINKTGIVKKEK